ncbi:MAG: hypothetical protein HYW49_04800 [Deltaproteobacteria bacterium]|nr:hypothetical protein [Deltaproteobacteria bacterium]
MSALILTVIGIGGLLGYAEVKSFAEKGTFMSLQDAEKKWGNIPFSASVFKTAQASERAKMAVSLIKGKSMLGKTTEEVRSALGDFSGYFWNDTVPTYFIQEGWKTGEDSWQLVFFLNRTHKVKEIKIHKNCCD